MSPLQIEERHPSSRNDPFIDVLASKRNCKVSSLDWSEGSQIIKRFLSSSLNVCDMGSFYIGGYPKVTLYAHGAADPTYHQITIGQMYVQFMIPHNSKKW